MNLPTNLFEGDMSVQIFLCQPDKTIIGEITPYDRNGTLKFNSYSEISFSIDKYYNDLFEGTTKINPYYELIEAIRVIYLRGIGHFIIQDVTESESDIYTKSVTCYSLEYSTGQKYLENFYVNTGEEGSVETMYHAQRYGAEYSIDNYYREITNNDKFDAYERYYIKEYSDTNSYNYVETPILDATKFGNYKEKLYIKKYPNVRFYWPTCPELSLLHLVFDRIPEWKIGHVDKELWYQERTFSEDRTAVYDFLYNTAAETLKFVMVWDSINGTTSFYITEEDGVTTDNYIRTNTYNPGFVYYSDTNGTVADPQPQNEDEVIKKVFYINVGQGIETQWDTDVFISHENLASTLDIKYSTDDIKTKLKITGSDNLDIRDVNLGQNYILNLSYYNTPLWLGDDLHQKYNAYTDDLAKYIEQYKGFISDWSAAYNEYSDLMNYVPAEPRVMLIGDEFEKLYCVYNRYLPASDEFDEDAKYFKYENLDYVEINNLDEDTFKNGNYYVLSSNTLKTLVERLQTKLETYKVDQKDNGDPSEIARTEDVLLTLENDASDSAIIRVRYDVDGSEYEVQRTLTNASTGISNTISFSLEEWVEGKLTANYKSTNGRNMNLSGFKIKSIGTLGAYFCLVRDETEKANLEDYGIRLLQEKQDTYTKIFITQTEGYMNKEGSQCVTSNEEPIGNEYPIGTKWLDTNNTKDGELIMKIRKNSGWETYIPDDNDYENYARFYENYVKLGNVQTVLSEKQKQADYLLNGMAVNPLYLTGENVNLNNLLRAAVIHFMVLNNDCYITKLREEAPSGSIKEGSVWFLINDETLSTSIYKYTSVSQNGSIVQTWVNYDPNVDIKLTGYDNYFHYITFTTSSDTNNEYATYVINGTPYVSYARSQGLSLAKMNVLKEASDMNTYFTEQELVRLSPFIREDEYSDDNFLLTGYESEEEQMYIKQELLDAGNDELKKICQPKLSFSATMANILAIPEFAPLRKQFKLGNFIRVGIREGYIKRARLLEVQMNFDDPSDFSCTFGDLITTKSEIDKHAELLSMAVQAGKSVAANKSSWQKSVDKTNQIEKAIDDGLATATLEVGSANGQNLVWNDQGIWCRKLVDGTTDQFEDEQIRIINNKILYSTDGFRSAESAFGSFEYNGQKYSGVIARALVGGVVHGAEIFGGKMEIGGDGGKFVVNEDGSVQILGPDAKTPIYATKSDMDLIEQATKYRVELSYEGNTIFNTVGQKCTVTCKVYEGTKEITKELPSTTIFTWYLNGVLHKSTTIPEIEIVNDDFSGSTQLNCQVTFDE